MFTYSRTNMVIGSRTLWPNTLETGMVIYARQVFFSNRWQSWRLILESEGQKHFQGSVANFANFANFP